ncbi:PucR family transcriptional regulator [Cohnella nanjingensis]|uniref:PucR family transcriptional regulator n=1 Tax=Cohnella nanjingensis TaxID=1387779 RepID=A0A7X0RWH7_9BACL|nr:PucR family transcriptional regulator [Cohnella nanjingensis]MBB6673399.1 PucR family transcriptional regulator [Cohnella nanjingensis]
MAAMPRKESLPENRPDQTMLSVRELLELPPLDGARLAAGERGAGAVVARVRVLESPDAARWARAGEWVLLPGREEPERLGQLFAELARQGVAAVGLRSARLADPETLKAALDEADAVGLPVVELPGDLALADVVRAVMERASPNEETPLAELQSRIQAMTRLMLEGSGLLALLDAMERMLGNPVAVVQEHDQPWVSESLREAEAPFAGPLAQALAYRHMAGRGARGVFVTQQSAYRVYVCPIPSRRSKPANLLLIERHADIDSLGMLSMDRLSVLIGMELANEEAVREVEGKYLEQFLQDWLSGKIVAAGDWKLRAEVCGCSLPEDTPLCAVLVGMSERHPSPDRLRELARRLRAERFRTVETLLASPFGGELALIVPVPETDRAEPQSASAVSALLERLQPELRSLIGDASLRLFAGRPAGRPELLPMSLSQARRARQVAEVCGLPGERVAYDRLGVYSLLYLIPSSEERAQFLERFAHPLQQADRKGGGRLVETLEMFFRCNGNIKLTSEKLYAHYNTVVYRLDKIQNILGVSLDDPEDRLQLQLSLKLGHITPAGN